MKTDFDPDDKNIYNEPEYWEFVSNFYNNSLKLGLEDDPQIVELNKQAKIIREQALREMRRIKRESSFRWKFLKTLRKFYSVFISFKHFFYSVIKFK